jgi:hypothetical protein
MVEIEEARQLVEDLELGRGSPEDLDDGPAASGRPMSCLRKPSVELRCDLLADGTRLGLRYLSYLIFGLTLSYDAGRG